MSEITKLKELFWAQREENPEDLNLKTYRALSWVARAGEVMDTDIDAAFIFGWIAFNAAYARELEDHLHAREEFEEFFEMLDKLDTPRRIQATIWNYQAETVKSLLKNKYLCRRFWRFHNGNGTYRDWERYFRQEWEKASEAVRDRNIPVLLSIIFDRLYVLRNQLVHGGATWNGSVNREQVELGARLMTSLVPEFVNTMIRNPNAEWGVPFYPVVK